MTQDSSARAEREYYSSIHCISIVANHFGFNNQFEDFYLNFDIIKKPNRKSILKITRKIGFIKSHYLKVTPGKIFKIATAVPFITQFKNGHWVIILSINDSSGDSDAKVIFLDPQTSDEMQEISPEEFFSRNHGKSLFFKPPFSLKWFLPIILNHKREFFDVFLTAIFITLIGLVTPIFFQIVIDKVIVFKSPSTLQALGFGIVTALLLGAILKYLQDYNVLHATTRIDTNINIRIFNHLLMLPLGFFERVPAGVLAKHVEQGRQIREFLTGALFMTALESLALLVFVPLLIFYNQTLALVVISFIFLIAFIIGIMVPIFRVKLQKLYKAQANRQAMLIETIRGILTIKSSVIEPIQKQIWRQKTTAEIDTQLSVQKVSLTASTLSQFLEKMMTVAILWLGAISVFSGKMTVGELVAFQIISGRVSSPLVQLVMLIHTYQEAILSVKMLGTVMNTDPEPGAYLQSSPPDVSEGIDIRYDNVNFTYPGRKEPVFQDFNFYIPKGKIIGVVGRSGSGKSTLIKLLLGIIHPESGQLIINGMDQREINTKFIRSNIGIVLQENFLFKGTIKDNIRMSNPEASFNEIVRVAQLSGASKFIEKLSKSYDTELEESGTNISGGQRQRIAIARALLISPKLLILDEATSALDPESEQIFLTNLPAIAEARTVIVISHRLAMLSQADGIMLLDQGKVVDYHTHQTLLKRCSKYKKMWDLQHESQPQK